MNFFNFNWRNKTKGKSFLKNLFLKKRGEDKQIKPKENVNCNANAQSHT